MVRLENNQVQCLNSQHSVIKFYDILLGNIKTLAKVINTVRKMDSSNHSPRTAPRACWLIHSVCFCHQGRPPGPWDMFLSLTLSPAKINFIILEWRHRKLLIKSGRCHFELGGGGDDKRARWENLLSKFLVGVWCNATYKANHNGPSKLPPRAHHVCTGWESLSWKQPEWSPATP